jgi:O-antigen ligase
MIRLMVWALVFCAVASVCLGFLGIQPMPGENLRSGQLELFHGIGMPQYMTAACACLITWVLARQLADPSARSIGPILLLLVVPVLSLYRAFLIGIVTSIIVAALIGVSRRRQNPGKKLGSGVKRLLLLTLLSLVLGTVAFWMKTSTREEGNELSGREIIWPIEIASIIQHPWFGLGPFGDVQLLFFDEGLNEVGAAHSEYLGAAVCYGLPGLFLFIGTLVALRRRIRRSLPSTLEERICKDAALLSLVALSTTIIAENVIRDPRLFALYLLFPALCLSAGAAGSQKAVR